MEFKHLDNQEGAGEIMAEKIGGYLKQNKKVLWLLSGGSNIGIEVETLKILKAKFSKNLKENLAVTLTDERFGPVKHKDSNWQQLLVNGFDMESVHAVPVLGNLELNETVIKFGKSYRDLIAQADVVIGQFGIGPDGHTAGVLPNTAGVSAKATACGYASEKFTRITLTLNALKNIDIAYTFVFGESKKEVIKLLQTQDLPLAQMPAQILKQISESYLYSDLI